MSAETFAWTGVLLLGVWHGLNPGMGWLFAVALGMQDRKGSAVWRALPPLALGHGLAIAGAIVLAAAVGTMVPLRALRYGVAAILCGFGVWKLLVRRHPRYGGMKVNARELTTWSALMASAHGAGLMVVPFVLGREAMAGQGMTGDGHAGHMAAMSGMGVETALAATLIHTAGYLLVAGLIAVLVYERFGLSRLRRVWVNLDAVWAAALITTGLVTPFL